MRDPRIQIHKLGLGVVFSGELEAKGTHYRVIAIRFPSNGYFGSLGTVTNGWLVVNCLNDRKAYLFQPSGILTDDYIQEKLGGLDGDYPELGNLVRALLSRSNISDVGLLADE